MFKKVYSGNSGFITECRKGHTAHPKTAQKEQPRFFLKFSLQFFTGTDFNRALTPPPYTNISVGEAFIYTATTSQKAKRIN